MKRLLKKVFKRFKQDVTPEQKTVTGQDVGPVEKALPGEYLPQESLWAKTTQTVKQSFDTVVSEMITALKNRERPPMLFGLPEQRCSACLSNAVRSVSYSNSGKRRVIKNI
jgi:hypothetical protein